MWFEILGLKIIFAEVGFDTLASARWLRQAQPPGFVLCLQTFGLCSANGEENCYEVLELDTPSFRFSECHPSKRGELYVLRFIEQLEFHPSERVELILGYFALTLMIWWRSVV